METKVLQDLAATEPSPEQAAEARLVLKELDPLLDIKWMPFMRRNGRGGFEGRYALICQWPQADNRWQMYHKGEIGEPFDVLGIYEELHGVLAIQGGDHAEDGETKGLMDPMAVMDATLQLLGSFDNERESWRYRLRKSAEHNAELRRKRMAEAQDEMLEGMKYYRRKIGHQPLVSVVKDLQESPAAEQRTQAEAEGDA